MLNNNNKNNKIFIFNGRNVIFNFLNYFIQILTQEDWNVVLFNGMEKTSHWAALYFVALMTFGNYVLFNLLVAILVEGFSSEVRIIFLFSKIEHLKLIIFYMKVWPLKKPLFFQRHERREREQRELAKQQAALQRKYSECYSEDVYSSCSLSEQDSFYHVIFFFVCIYIILSILCNLKKNKLLINKTKIGNEK